MSNFDNYVKKNAKLMASWLNWNAYEHPNHSAPMQPPTVDAVDPITGEFIAHLIEFNEAGAIACEHAFDILESLNYDTTFAKFGDMGELIVESPSNAQAQFQNTYSPDAISEAAQYVMDSMRRNDPDNDLLWPSVEDDQLEDDLFEDDQPIKLETRIEEFTKTTEESNGMTKTTERSTVTSYIETYPDPYVQ